MSPDGGALLVHNFILSEHHNKAGIAKMVFFNCLGLVISKIISSITILIMNQIS
jgi:hypothetical protein